MEVGFLRQNNRPFLGQLRSSLTEVTHVALRGAPLEMTDKTKGVVQRCRTLGPRCFEEADLENTSHDSLSR
jgi:hypothetical protein